MVLQWLLLLPFLHELRCKAGDFSALCTTAQAKHGGLPASFEQIERVLQKGDGIDVDAERLRALLEHVAAIHRVRTEAAVMMSSKTRNPKGREAVECDAQPD